MRIAIGCDHRGYQQKMNIKQMQNLIKEHTIEWYDVGCSSQVRCDYPEFAIAVAQHVQKGSADRGILLCGTGNGMVIAANRFRGVYAAIAWNIEIAHLAYAHDKANVLVIPAEYVSERLLEEMIHAWLSASFLGGRYEERIMQIDSIGM